MEEKQASYKKQSDSMINARFNESDEKKIKRKKSLQQTLKENPEINIIRANKISNSKKGKSTQQQEIMKLKYKSMSDEEFDLYCNNIKAITENRRLGIIKRMKNLRNKE